jgi:IPT/TIG domain
LIKEVIPAKASPVLKG